MSENWFLKIDGIEGESTDVAHKAEIDVLSWSWGVANTTDGGSGSGVGTGKAAFQDFQFVAKISKASPMLFLSCATGIHHKTAALTGVRSGVKGTSAEFLKYKLSDVVVTTDQHSGSEGGEPVEQFSLKYNKIEVSYTAQLASGKFDKVVRTGFDLKASKGY